MDFRRAAGAFQKGYSQGAESARHAAEAQEARQREIDAVKIDSPFFLTLTWFWLVVIALLVLLAATARETGGLSSLVAAVVWMLYLRPFFSRRQKAKLKILEDRESMKSE